MRVQDAWEILRDADCREEYDCRVDLQAGNVVISDEVGEATYSSTRGYIRYTPLVPEYARRTPGNTFNSDICLYIRVSYDLVLVFNARVSAAATPGMVPGIPLFVHTL